VPDAFIEQLFGEKMTVLKVIQNKWKPLLKFFVCLQTNNISFLAIDTCRAKLRKFFPCIPSEIAPIQNSHERSS